MANIDYKYMTITRSDSGVEVVYQVFEGEEKDVTVNEQDGTSSVERRYSRTKRLGGGELALPVNARDSAIKAKVKAEALKLSVLPLIVKQR